MKRKAQVPPYSLQTKVQGSGNTNAPAPQRILRSYCYARHKRCMLQIYRRKIIEFFVVALTAYHREIGNGYLR